MKILRHKVSPAGTREDKSETKRLSREEGRARRKNVETFRANIRVYTDEGVKSTKVTVKLDNGRPLVVERNRQGKITNQREADVLGEHAAQAYIASLERKALEEKLDEVSDYEARWHASLDERCEQRLPNGRRAFALKTARDYKRHLSSSFLNSTRAKDGKRWRDISPLDWTVVDFHRWFKDEIKARGVGFSWANQLQFIVGTFCKFLRKQGVAVPVLNEERHPVTEDDAKVFVPAKVEKRVTWYSPDECQKILKCARTWKNRYGYFAGMYLPVAIAIYLGLRINEIFWLRWDYFDLKKKVLHLDPAIVKCEDAETPYLDLPDDLIVALKSVPAAVRDARDEKGHGSWVIWPESPRNEGKDFNSRDDVLKDIVTAAKCSREEGDGWHRFRRSVATNLLAAGIEEGDVKSITRHTSKAFDRYKGAAAKAAQRKRAVKGINAVYGS
jgi:integrase